MGEEWDGLRAPDAAQHAAFRGVVRCRSGAHTEPPEVPALRCTVEVTLHRVRDTHALTSSADTHYP